MRGPVPAWRDVLPDGRPAIMGIVNVTPDSFSDGGQFLDPADAISHGRRLVDEGADILDIGGESTRPGADPVSPEAEASRVLPVIRGLAEADAPISIDTRNAAVMRAALDAGAVIVNDVSALTHDPDSLPLVADRDALVVLMHMRGDPATMNEAPSYDDVGTEVAQYLHARAGAALAAGVARERIALDPGIGFGKQRRHNIDALAAVPTLAKDGFPVLVGASRKFAPPDAPDGVRLATSVAAAIAAADLGASIIRVHDVAPTVAGLRLWAAARDATNVRSGD